MRYRIYLDILFLINFGMDAWILWLTGKLCRKHLVWWRQLIAALAGAFLVTILVWIPVPKAWIYTVLGYGVTGLFMCWLAFSPHSVWEMVKSYLCMLGVTFLLGGIMNWLYLETGLGTYIKKTLYGKRIRASRTHNTGNCIRCHIRYSGDRSSRYPRGMAKSLLSGNFVLER